MPAPPPPPKARVIGNPMALLPKQQGSPRALPHKSKKDVAEEYRALASNDPPGARALHTRRVSTVPSTANTAIQAPRPRSPPCRSSPKGSHTYLPEDKGLPPLPLPNHYNEAMSFPVQRSSVKLLPGQPGPQSLLYRRQKAAECARLTTELRIDIGPTYEAYCQAAKVLGCGAIDRVGRTTSMFSRALRRKRQALMVLPEEIRLSQAVSHAWKGSEAWEELYVSHAGKIRIEASVQELGELLQIGQIMLEETWRAMGALIDAVYEQMAIYSHATEDNASSSSIAHEEIITRIDTILEKPITGAEGTPQQTFARGLLTRLRGFMVQKKKSRGRKNSKVTEEAEDASFELVENFNLCNVSGVTPRPGRHRRTASDLVLDSLDSAEDQHIVELNLSLRASRIIFDNVASASKYTPHRRSEECTDVIYDDTGVMVFCTVAELVRRLTDRFEVRNAETTALMDTFFMFFREFMTPNELFLLLKARFEEKPPKSLDANKMKEWNRYQTVVKLHVVRMFAIWLDRYYLVAHDGPTLIDILNFVAHIGRDRSLPPHATELLVAHVNTCMKTDKGEHHTAVLDQIVRIGSAHTPSFPETAFQPCIHVLSDAINKSRTLPDILIFTKPDGATELARAFTCIESEIFHMSYPQELVKCDEKHSHPIFDKMNRWTHAVNLWVSRCIIERRELETSARVFELFVEVAVNCQNMRNYSSAMSLFLALESSRITRLTQMMDLVSERHKAMLAGMKAFFDFCGSKQWQNYRDDLRRHHGPAIPLLVTIKSDIIKIKAAREIARNKYKPGKGFVDIMMYKKLREIVRELESCFADYHLPRDSFVARWLYSSVRPFEDKDYATWDKKYTEESKKIQPPALKRQRSWHQDDLWALGSWDKA